LLLIVERGLHRFDATFRNGALGKKVSSVVRLAMLSDNAARTQVAEQQSEWVGFGGVFAHRGATELPPHLAARNTSILVDGADNLEVGLRAIFNPFQGELDRRRW
jgi:hypothetical protein